MKFTLIVGVTLLPVMAFAANSGRDPRIAMRNQAMVASVSAQDQANRASVASKNQLAAQSAIVTADNDKSMSPSIKAQDVAPGVPKNQEKDKREAERMACVNNNIGVGNTFVWASRYSNISSYATMQEDVENPENNVCFVKVDLRSTDSRIDLSDIPGKYFQWGQNIECGSWVDESMLEKRILDAKKTGRTWATVGGAVGGAAIGVGSMELFGNKLIGGAVQGQESLSGKELLRSQLLAMKKSGDLTQYNSLRSDIQELQSLCKELKQIGGTHDSCDDIDYDSLLNI